MARQKCRKQNQWRGTSNDRRSTSLRPTTMTKSDNHREDLPQRKHLHRLQRIYVHPPIFLITICTLGRRPVLANISMAEAICTALQDAARRNRWRVGRYVIMLDHIHFFCTPAEQPLSLSAFVGGFKEASTRQAWQSGWQGRLWQREFFDHLLRSEESYQEKWDYVRLNPVRAGLCETAEEWPHQGEIEVL